MKSNVHVLSPKEDSVEWILNYSLAQNYEAVFVIGFKGPDIDLNSSRINDALTKVGCLEQAKQRILEK